MKRTLPARPSIEHLRSQAKTLLSQLKLGDKAAAAAFIEHLPAANRMTQNHVVRSKFKLADAQSVVARKNGYPNWPALLRHVETLRVMEGTWKFVRMEVDGSPYPASAFSTSRLLIDGDRFRMESPEADYEGIMTIDVEQAPHRIDIEFIEGPEAGNWSYGIFELDGDNFKICLGLTGASRPEAFVTSSGSSHALEHLKRASKTRPKDVKGGTPQQPKTVATAPPPVDLSEFELKRTPLLDSLQGEWAPVQLVTDGQPLAETTFPYGSRLTDGNEVKVVFGGQVMLHVKMRIDESQSPLAVDYLHVGRSLKGKVTLGILELQGARVRICMAPAGQPRPTDFSCELGSGRTLSAWKRK